MRPLCLHLCLPPSVIPLSAPSGGPESGHRLSGEATFDLVPGGHPEQLHQSEESFSSLLIRRLVLHRPSAEFLPHSGPSFQNRRSNIWHSSCTSVRRDSHDQRKWWMIKFSLHYSKCKNEATCKCLGILVKRRLKQCMLKLKYSSEFRSLHLNAGSAF